MATPSGEWKPTQRWEEVTTLFTFSFKNNDITTRQITVAGQAQERKTKLLHTHTLNMNNTRWSKQRGGEEVNAPFPCLRAPQSNAVVAKTLSSSHRGHADTQSERF